MSRGVQEDHYKITYVDLNLGLIVFVSILYFCRR